MKTAECVSPRHPDKICDIISDAVLDECLRQDKNSRVAIETMGGHGIITVTGELTTEAYVDVREIVREVVGDKYGVQTNIVKQSPEIAQGVDTGGAGDQGIMVGYACNENASMIPQELFLARDLCKAIYKKFPYDGKTQITLNEKNEIVAVVASFQNSKKSELESLVKNWLAKKKHNGIEIFCNPAGDWNQGGFEADTGVTGRKLACDNYGPQIPIGGGAYSGKDSTKVDRSGAYIARKLAVEALKKYKAKEVIAKVAYAIGEKYPVMATLLIDGKETKINQKQIRLTPKGIISELNLNKPQFKEVAQWGSFGNGFEWDK